VNDGIKRRRIEEGSSGLIHGLSAYSDNWTAGSAFGWSGSEDHPMDEPNDIEDGSILDQDADDQAGSHNASSGQEPSNLLDGNRDESEHNQDDEKTSDEIPSKQAEDQYERSKRNKSAGHSTFTSTLTISKKKRKRSKKVQNSSPFVKLERSHIFPESMRHSSYLDTELLVSNNHFSISKCGHPKYSRPIARRSLSKWIDQRLDWKDRRRW